MIPLGGSFLGEGRAPLFLRVESMASEAVRVNRQDFLSTPGLLFTVDDWPPVCLYMLD